MGRCVLAVCPLRTGEQSLPGCVATCEILEIIQLLYSITPLACVLTPPCPPRPSLLRAGAALANGVSTAQAIGGNAKAISQVVAKTLNGPAVANGASSAMAVGGNAISGSDVTAEAVNGSALAQSKGDSLSIGGSALSQNKATASAVNGNAVADSSSSAVSFGNGHQQQPIWDCGSMLC